MVNNFMYNAPTQVHFGKGSISKVGSLIKDLGYKKVLVHYGSNSAVKNGTIKKVEDSLKSEGIEYITLGGVVPNPRISKVIEGRDLCRKENVDFVLAVGGGSVIDSSKAICYTVPYEGDPWYFWESKANKVEKALPLGAVLTIAAAGSEMSNSCVITNEEDGKKRGSSSELGRPKFALLDPELTMTLPDYQSMAGATDIIMHTMERYFTPKGNMELTDYIAEGLIKTVIHNAKIIHKDPMNYDARAEIMWAGSLSHNGLTGCGNGGDDFATHGLEHELSAMYDVTHGPGLSAVWGSWARFVMDNIPERFAKFAVDVMGIEKTDDLKALGEKGISAMEDFFISIGMPVTLKELGISPSDADLKELAKKYSAASGGGKGAAKYIGEEEAYLVYKAAM